MKRITMTPQNRTVFHHLRTIGALTHMSAQLNYRIGRLAARVDELKKLGFRIKTTMKTINRRRYASYTLGV